MAKTEASRKEALRKAYATATTRLRESRKDEFNRLYQEAAQELGVEWSPRPTEEQQAEATVTDLLTRFPQLRERLSAEPSSEERE